MTAATAVPPDVAAYLAAVRASLNDLPDAERDDLVSEVEASLVASIEEGAPIAARLGPPEEFAAELRAAAGLHEPAPQPRPPSRVAMLAARLARSPRVAAGRRLALELAPIWWAARAYLAVGVVTFGMDAEWSGRFPPRLDGLATTVLVFALAGAMSVWLGLHARRHGSRFPRLALALNVALALAAVPVAQKIDDARGVTGVVFAAPPPTPGLTYDGAPVDNIYPYTRGGELLHDVLLYDGAGRPLEIRFDRSMDPDRRIVVTNGNEPLFNVFPIRYFEPGTKRVARPNAAPYVEHPIVLTPPLRP